MNTKRHTRPAPPAIDAATYAQAAARRALDNGATPHEANVAYMAAYATRCGNPQVTAHSTGATNRKGRRGVFTRTGGFLINGIVLAVAMLAAVVLSTAAAQGQTVQTVTAWDKVTLTVHVTDKAAWSGTDVLGVLEMWSPAMGLTLTDDPGADVTLTSAAAGERVAATAYRTPEVGAIESCRIVLSAELAGKDATDVLAHEMGHCLGLGHTPLSEASQSPSVMYWMVYGSAFSPVPSAADLDAVRNLHK